MPISSSTSSLFCFSGSSTAGSKATPHLPHWVASSEIKEPHSGHRKNWVSSFLYQKPSTSGSISGEGASSSSSNSKATLQLAHFSASSASREPHMGHMERPVVVSSLSDDFSSTSSMTSAYSLMLDARPVPTPGISESSSKGHS